ncbi:TPA: DUF551 domain-containing protein [Klebsiella quasipneumoniae subsp. similipneumoniae]|nr:DUF551 domain-containing protein [Klebsiella quasipneumoniae subsp. similipneumoniae]
MARIALAAMESSESVELPLDYLQGHKDGLEWAAQLAESNHPETGDWLYDDPIELAKAIRKGPDMPPAQPAADSEPVAIIDQANLDYLRSGADADVWPPEREEMGDVLLYRHAQPVEQENDMSRICAESYQVVGALAEALNIFDDPCVIKAPDNLSAQELVHEDVLPFSVDESAQPAPGKWIPVSERMPENDGAYLCWDNRYVTTYAFIFGAWQANQFIAKNITHWMPLPASPQEVK